MQYPVLWALFAVLLLSTVLPFTLTLFRLLRYDVGRVTLKRDPALAPLSALHQAAVDEVKALGFLTSISYTLNDTYDDTPAIMFRHQDLPVFATMYLRAHPFTSYPVWFWSFAPDGAILMTSNRQPTSRDIAGVLRADPYADTLAGHWQAHQERLKSAEVVAVEPEAAFQRIASLAEHYGDKELSTCSLTGHPASRFFSFRTALKMTIEAMRRRRHLRRSYKSVVTQDTYRSAYFVDLYQVYESVKLRLKHRRDVAFVALVLSLILSFGLFSWWMGWRFASALILVLFVHESGHAIAMRFFGYRDMSMFFVPFAGAVVTGQIKSISVWRQTIVLLAGPVPGLLVGIWILLHLHSYPPGGFVQLLGINAAVLNLFNLLPLSFLDGGRLLEIAFLSRWPYALFAFSVASFFAMTLLIVTSKSYNLWAIALVLAMSSRLLWRSARIRKAWAAHSGGRKASLQELFEFVAGIFPSRAFHRHYPVVRAIHEPAIVNAPRGWETVLALALFFFFWATSGVAWSFWDQDRAAERNFDKVVLGYYSDYKKPDSLEPTLAAARLLDADDPRQIDVLAMQAYRQKNPARDAALEKILALGREGWSFTRAFIVQRYLSDATLAAQNEKPADGIARLRGALAKIDELAPDAFTQTVDTRLKLAELYGKEGRTAEAQALLSTLKGQTAER